jgi:hypothetical protein
MFDLATNARFIFGSLPLKHVLTVFIVFHKKIKKQKNWGRRCRILFFLLIAFQILHVFLPDISVQYALLEYAYI